MNLFRFNREKLDKNNPNEMYYDTQILSNLKYAKVIYMGQDNKYHEIQTDVKFISDTLISLYFDYSYDFNINYPQDIILKLVTPDAMYLAKTVLKDLKKTGKTIWFSVISPAKMVRRQERKFSRANIDCSCVLNVCDERGRGEIFLAKTINLSGSGILIHKPENMDSNDIVELNLSQDRLYNLILILEKDEILKLSARFVRSSCNENSLKYAFQFLSMEKKNTDIICQKVTNILKNA